MKTSKTLSGSFNVPVEFKVMKGFGGGFRTEWVSAEDVKEGFRAGLDSGAGLGNPCLTFWIEAKGKREYFTADITKVLTEAIKKARGGK